MFIEPNISGERRGSIEVICGSMFSGKTEELIRRLKRARIAHLKVEIFKPALDIRYNEEAVVSHDANSIGSFPIDHSQKILLLADQVDVVGIDEAQFFDDQIVSVCKPFGQMPQLLAIADFITKLHAICVKCGNLANISYRKSADESHILLGATDSYEPRCRKCYHEH